MIKNVLLLIPAFLFTLCSHGQMLNNYEQGTGANGLNQPIYRNLTSSKKVVIGNPDHFSFNACNVPAVFGSAFSPSATADNVQSLATVCTSTTEPYLLSKGIIAYTVGPQGGYYSMRLGNRDPYAAFWNTKGFNGARTSYSQLFLADKKIVSFDYFTYFNSPHYDSLSVQPLFTARLLDFNDNIIETTPVLCLKADASDSRLLTNGEVTYMPGWQTHSYLIPDEYMGQNIRLQFVVTDCGQNGHQGVAYVDNVKKKEEDHFLVQGRVTLKNQQYVCPEGLFEVCGHFNSPSGYELQNLKLEIMDYNTLQTVTTLNLTSFDNTFAGSFCFEADRNSLPVPPGSYELKLVGSFKTPGGNTHTLTSFSSYSQGADLITGNNTPFQVSVINNPTYGDAYPGSATWTDLNTSYLVEWVSDEYCCPAHAGSNIIDGTIYTLTTTETKLDNLFNSMFLGTKCFRFRVRPVGQCYGNNHWSQWCCITTHSAYGGGYDPYDPNDPHNLCLDEIDLNNLTPYSPAPVALPNPTNGVVVLKNVRSKSLTVYDMDQKKVLSWYQTHNEQDAHIDLSGLKPGIYVLKTDRNEVKVIKR